MSLYIIVAAVRVSSDLAQTSSWFPLSTRGHLQKGRSAQMRAEKRKENTGAWKPVYSRNNQHLSQAAVATRCQPLSCVTLCLCNLWLQFCQSVKSGFRCNVDQRLNKHRGSNIHNSTRLFWLISLICVFTNSSNISEMVAKQMQSKRKQIQQWLLVADFVSSFLAFGVTDAGK